MIARTLQTVCTIVRTLQGVCTWQFVLYRLFGRAGVKRRGVSLGEHLGDDVVSTLGDCDCDCLCGLKEPEL
jgi:hypothetical protein